MNATPQTARLLFRCRDGVNILIALGGFGLLLLLLRTVLDAGLATVISMGIMLIIFYALLNNKPVGFDCPHCKQYIESNHPWICGFKQCRNDNADAYPFVHRCEHCGAEPKAYQCHHCGKLIFLSKDELASNYARCTKPFKERSDLDITGLEQDLHKAGLELSIAEVDKQMARVNTGPKKDQDAERIRQEELAKLEHQILLNKKRAELASEEAKAKFAAEVNLPLAERAEKRRARKLERFDIADKGRALAKEKYPLGGLNYDREMAFWDEFEEERSIPN
jgi:DNA-binding transcriptional MerR regulator